MLPSGFHRVDTGGVHAGVAEDVRKPQKILFHAIKNAGEQMFSGFSLFLPRIFGYYVTHAILVVCGLSLATLGFYRPDPRDIPRILKTFGLLAVGAHLINLLLRLTLCPEANYFFANGAEIGVLKLFWRIIPAPLLYGLPAPLILAGYMYAVCALSRLTQRAEEVPFS